MKISAWLVFLSLFVLVSCTGEPPQAMHRRGDHIHSATLVLSDVQARQIGLTVATVEQRILPQDVSVLGEVQENSTMVTPVISLVPGRVESVYVMLGDAVKKGQLLANIRSDEVAQIEADLLKEVMSLEAERRQVQADRELAQLTFDRKQVLYGEGIAAKADVEIARTDLEKARAAVAALEGKRQAIITAASERLRLFGVPPSEFQRVLASRLIDNTFDVLSPRTGIVTVREIDTGQLIDDAHRLFVVSDLTQVWLIANVFEKDIQLIQKGQPVEVTVDSFPASKFVGRIEYVSSQVQEDTRTLQVRAAVENPDLRLKAGMFARLKVRVGEAKVMAVPLEAVQRAGETSLAYVMVGPHAFAERKVEIGRTIGEYVEVTSGLQAGETVVARGSLQLLGQALQRVSR